MGSAEAEVQSGQILSRIEMTEELKGAPGVEGVTVTNAAFNPSVQQYSQTSTPPGKRWSAQTLTLSGGAKTVDLTALPGTQEDIDGTDLRVQAIRIQGASGNGALTISPGASNPYVLFGAGNDLEYPAACTKPFQMEFDGKLAVISGTVKTLDFAGTGTDEFELELLLG